jgi:hypothetical protein
MPITPTGRLSTSLHAVRDALIASPAWLAWCGAAPAAAADAYLVASPARVPRPHAIIDLDPSSFRRTRDGQTIGPFVHRGGVMLYLAAPVAAGLSDLDATTDYGNHVDAVLLDLESAPGLGGAGTVLNGISLMGGPTRIEAQLRDKHGDEIEAQFLLDVTVWP